MATTLISNPLNSKAVDVMVRVWPIARYLDGLINSTHALAKSNKNPTVADTTPIPMQR